MWLLLVEQCGWWGNGTTFPFSLPAASLGYASSWAPLGVSSHELSSLLSAPVSVGMKLPSSLFISATGCYHSHLLLHHLSEVR